MEKINNRKQRIREALPFICFFVLVGIWHILVNVMTRDDEYFSVAIKATNTTFFDFLKLRYQTWSSRVIIEAVLLWIVHHEVLWRILDTLIFTSIPYLMSRILDCDEKGRWFCCFMTFLYPINSMGEAGWITTTVNYLWPLGCVFYLGFLLKKLVKEEKIRAYEYFTAAVAIIFGSDQEQCAAIIFTLFVLIIAYKLYKKDFKQPFLYLEFFLHLLTFGFILRCPGNANRSAMEAANRMPKFSEFSIGKKIYLGLLSTVRELIAIPNRLIIVVMIILVLLMIRKTSKLLPLLVSMIPLGIVMGYSLLLDVFPDFGAIFFVPKQTVKYALKNAIPIGFLFLIIISISYSLYQLLGENIQQYLLILGILGAGLATALVLGFSPTVYASGTRVFLYFQFTLIFTCLFCWEKVSCRKQEISGEDKVWILIGFAWTLAQFAYVCWRLMHYEF